ncbi:hypothetical protein BGV68_06850 [Burkholderia ubonensis]|nr:hypothetical protein BGV68_06850 [Burkholderia ubonensis]
MRASLNESHWSANGASATCCAGVRRAHDSGPAAAGSGARSAVSAMAADASAGALVATATASGCGWKRGYVAT